MIAPPQSDSLLLPGGARMPLIGFGTYKVDKADSVRCAGTTLFARKHALHELKPTQQDMGLSSCKTCFECGFVHPSCYVVQCSQLACLHSRFLLADFVARQLVSTQLILLLSASCCTERLIRRLISRSTNADDMPLLLQACCPCSHPTPSPACYPERFSWEQKSGLVLEM